VARIFLVSRRHMVNIEFFFDLCHCAYKRNYTDKMPGLRAY
jgi:hypothetical protein